MLDHPAVALMLFRDTHSSWASRRRSDWLQAAVFFRPASTATTTTLTTAATALHCAWHGILTQERHHLASLAQGLTDIKFALATRTQKASATAPRGVGPPWRSRRPSFPPKVSSARPGAPPALHRPTPTLCMAWHGMGYGTPDGAPNGSTNATPSALFHCAWDPRQGPLWVASNPCFSLLRRCPTFRSGRGCAGALQIPCAPPAQKGQNSGWPASYPRQGRPLRGASTPEPHVCSSFAMP